MSDLTRREAVQILGAAPLLAAGISSRSVTRAALAVREAQAAGAAFEPAFFTAHELATVRVLSDLIIPRDDRSGSATDAGVPEFMDFILNENPGKRTSIRGGLAWLDGVAFGQGGRDFVSLPAEKQTGILDQIAWPGKARPEMSQGVAFFSDFRDLTASGFFSSKMGVEDLRYIGNQFVVEWQGCPPDALAHLGVRYPE